MPVPARSRLATFVLLPLVSLSPLGALACAPAAGPAGSAPGLSQTGRQSDVISERELADPALVDKSVLEAIQRLRPRFLDSRSSTVRDGSTPIRMSLDGANPQDASELARISVAEVSEIRYLSIADANLRFGMGGTVGPVILVTMKHH